MFGFLVASGIDDLEVDTVAPTYPLGTVIYYAHPDYGPQFYRYVHNNGSTIGVDLLVAQETGTDPYQVIVCGAAVATQRVYGVRQRTAFTADRFGFVLCNGIGQFESDGSTTADTAQKMVAAGQISDGTIGADSIVVHAMNTENPAGSGGKVIGRIACL